MRFLPFLLLVACLGPDTGEETDPDSDSSNIPCEDRDADADGVNACDDCDDADAGVFPGAPERCNGLDDDCDGDLHPDELETDEAGVPTCASCDAAGFWEITRDTSDAQLGDRFADAMVGLRCNYSTTAAWMFTRLDVEASQVECVYTGRRTTINGQRPDPETDMNVEHTWPQSDGAGDLPKKCDLHHLFPTDVDANQQRAAYPFGEVQSGSRWSEGGSELGNDSSGERVFEPRDVHKGNVARAMLYMSMEYDWSLSADQVELFVEWNALDPIDTAERERSLNIGEEQSFANPMVVCPNVVERVYGD
jgi:endonuclease I